MRHEERLQSLWIIEEQALREANKMFAWIDELSGETNKTINNERKPS